MISINAHKLLHMYLFSDFCFGIYSPCYILNISKNCKLVLLQNTVANLSSLIKGVHKIFSCVQVDMSSFNACVPFYF